MQNQILISIYDSKSDTWTPPFATINAEVAKRDLNSQLTHPQAQDLPICKYPEDYVLYVCGEFENGKLIGYDAPRSLGNVFQILNEFRLLARKQRETIEQLDNNENA